MLKKILFASHNQKKIQEIQRLSEGFFELKSLKDIDYKYDIEETGTTFFENARIKAQTLFRKTNMSVLADDSGLQVDALGGAPGVFSARYAGAQANSEKNMEKLLKNMHQIENRKARFVCVLCLYTPLYYAFFEGIIQGHIKHSKQGDQGFGYDPLFVPKGYEQSFAQMHATQKNQISHRAQAWKSFMGFVSQKS